MISLVTGPVVPSRARANWDDGAREAVPLWITVPGVELIFPAILSKTSWRSVMISTNWSALTEPSRLGRSDRSIVVPTEASASVSVFWTAGMSVIERGTSPMVTTGRVVTIGWPAPSSMSPRAAETLLIVSLSPVSRSGLMVFMVKITFHLSLLRCRLTVVS